MVSAARALPQAQWNKVNVELPAGIEPAMVGNCWGLVPVCGLNITCQKGTQ
jgi:hypothetical protein